MRASRVILGIFAATFLVNGVVNAFGRLTRYGIDGEPDTPPGLVARRITDLPAVTYHAAYRRRTRDDPRVVALLKAIRARAAKPPRTST